jgi:hypothetical protein
MRIVPAAIAPRSPFCPASKRLADAQKIPTSSSRR